MNKANNRITIRLQSDLDGSLGVEHAKDMTLAMVITDHIDAHVDAFRTFLLAAAFPQKLVDNAFNEHDLIAWRRRASRFANERGAAILRAQVAEIEIAGLKTALYEAKDLIVELQEANDMLSAANQTGDFLVELQQREAALDGEVRTRANAINGLASSMPCPHRFPNGRCTKPRCLVPNACEYDAKPANPLSIESLSAECERRESAARGHPADTVIHRDNSVNLYAHDSLLEPTPMVKVDAPNWECGSCSTEFYSDEHFGDDDVKCPKCGATRDHQFIPPNIAATDKPPTQVLSVTGINAVKFGNCGKANGVDSHVAARLNKLVNDPHFQQFAIAFTKTPYETVMDAVKFCVEFVQANAFKASFDKAQPIKFDPALYATMNELFAQWAKEQGITLE